MPLDIIKIAVTINIITITPSLPSTSSTKSSSPSPSLLSLLLLFYEYSLKIFSNGRIASAVQSENEDLNVDRKKFKRSTGRKRDLCLQTRSVFPLRPWRPRCPPCRCWSDAWNGEKLCWKWCRRADCSEALDLDWTRSVWSSWTSADSSGTSCASPAVDSSNCLPRMRAGRIQIVECWCLSSNILLCNDC